MRTYVYFVSYAYQTGFGWVELGLPFKVTTGDHVKAIQGEVERTGINNVSVLSFQLLRVEGPA
jgi:hypothetical protein